MTDNPDAHVFRVEITGNAPRLVEANPGDEAGYTAAERYKKWFGIAATEHTPKVERVAAKELEELTTATEDRPAERVICLTDKPPLHADPRFDKTFRRKVSRLNPVHDPNMIGTEHVPYATVEDGYLVEV